jgi:hypothetical protein
LTPEAARGIDPRAGAPQGRPAEALKMTPAAKSRQPIWSFAETMAFAAAGGAAFNYLGFPAGWMAGSLLCSALAALCARPIHVPTPMARLFFIALGIVIGGVATPETMRGMATWPASIVFISVAMIALTIASATYLQLVHGWDVQTALFSAVPGALSQVSAIAMERDADLRAIIIVQTVRVVILAVGVPMGLAIAGIAAPPRAIAGAVGYVDAPLQLLALVVAGTAAAFALYRVGFSGGFFFGPMIVSAALHGSGLVQLNLPVWIANIAMIGLGAINGARFNKTSFRLLLSFLLPSLGALAVSLSVAALFVALAMLLMPLKLANLVVSYSPGSVDVMMILALALHLDPVFIGAHHLARILVVSIALPVGARLTDPRKPHAHELPEPLETARETLED